MRWFLAFLVLLIPAAFVVGHETSSSTTPPAVRTTSTQSSTHVYTIRGGDVVRVPTTATRCEASYEGGVPNFFCTRNFEGRYQVVFYKEAVYVLRVGDPSPENTHVFRWAP
jgi:hypothetical protein